MRRKSQVGFAVAAVIVLAAACAPATTLPPTAAATLPATTLPPTAVPTLPPTPTAIPTRAPTRTPAPTVAPSATPLPDPLRPVVAIEDVLPGAFRSLRPAPDGGLWLITDQGVAKLLDNVWTVHLSGFTGSLAGIDAAGRVWVVSEDAGTISAWDGAAWTDYGAEAGWLPIGLEDEWYRDAGWGQSDGWGRFWLTTSQDVRVFDGARWTVFTPQDMGMQEAGPEELWPSFVVEVSPGTGVVWVGECDWGGPGPFGGQGVRWFDGSTWYGADSPVASGCATVIEEDQAGRVWLGVDGSLWRYEPASGNWTPSTPPESPVDEMRFGFADTIALAPSGDPWPAMVLCGGASCYGSIALYHVHDGAWTQIGAVAEYEGPYSLVFDAAGTPWLFWDGAVYRLSGDAPEPLADLYIRSAQSATVDGAGRVWFVAPVEGRLWLLTLQSHP